MKLQVIRRCLAVIVPLCFVLGTTTTSCHNAANAAVGTLSAKTLSSKKIGTEPPVFQNSATATLTTNGAANLDGYNVRVLVSASALSISGTLVKVRFVPRSSGGSGLTVSHAFICEQASSGDAYDCASTPTRITFSMGSNGFSASSGGGSVISDMIPFALDETKSYIISYAISGTSNVRFGSASGWSTYYKSAAAADVDTVDVSGYSSDAGVSYSVDLIQVAN